MTDHDPLASALDSPPYLIDDFEAEAARIRAALDAAGYEVRPIRRFSADDVEARRLASWQNDREQDRRQAAVAAERQRIKAAVEALPPMAISSSTDTQRQPGWINRKAVLDIIDGEAT